MVVLVLAIGLKLYNTLPARLESMVAADADEEQVSHEEGDDFNGKQKLEDQEDTSNTEEISADEQEKQDLAKLIKHISIGDEQALMHLSERHQQLQKLEDELRDKENIIAATKQYMENKVEEMKTLQDSIKSLVAAYHKEEEARIHSLVKIYENMRTQDAAQIFDDLNISTLLPVIDRMKEAKVAALLGKMRPEKARQVTMRLLDNQGELEPKNYNLCACE